MRNAVVANIAVTLALTFASAAECHPVYVPSYSTGEVLVLDMPAGTLLGAVSGVGAPIGVDLSADGSRLFVSDAGGAVLVVDAQSLTVERRIAVATPPTPWMAVSPDGLTLQVPSRLSPGEGGVYAFEIASGALIGTTRGLPNTPAGVDYSPHGDILLVADGNDHSVGEVDPAAFLVLDRWPTGGFEPQTLVAEPHGDALFVAHNGASVGAGEVVEVDRTSGLVRRRVPVPTAQDLALVPCGGRLHVSSPSTDRVYAIDVATFSVAAVIAVGDDPAGIAASPDGAWIYVVNRQGGTLSVIDAAANVEIDRVPLGVMHANYRLAAGPDSAPVHSCDRAGGKVRICHVPPGNPEAARELCVATASVAAHLEHGDQLGPCPCD